MDPQKSHDDVISSLVKESGWLSDDNYPLYLYQGFWRYGFTLKGAIAAYTQTLPFDPNPSDIVIASNPKSGTTWLKALAFAITTRARFSPSDPNNPLYLKNPHDLIPLMEVDNTSGRRDLNLVSTHLPYTFLPASVVARGCKIVYIWRDPKDAFISLWHMSKKTRPNQETSEPIPLQKAFDLFCKGVSPSGPYWDHTLGYLKAFQDRPESILILKYEDMMGDVEGNVKRLAEFMGHPFSAVEEEEGVVSKIVEMCSFERLSNLDVNKAGEFRALGTLNYSKDVFFRKAKVGDWSNYLTHEMAAKIDQITMDKLGLDLVGAI